jgi:exodeoxyribonuclease VII large subunit
MQGETTEHSVTESLDIISGEAARFDAVVIIRGGGSTTDLSWFDSYDIAYHVTQFPLPVITGIGHEKDLSVTDMVAWRSLKTPTAVADFLVGQVLECENHIVEMAETLSSAAGDIITSAGEQLASLLNRTTATARLHLRVKSEQIIHHTENLRKSGYNSIRSANDTAERLEQSLKHLDPAGVMKRGFTITTKEGQIIRSSADLHPGDTVLTHFDDGKASSTVRETSSKI